MGNAPEERERRMKNDRKKIDDKFEEKSDKYKMKKKNEVRIKRRRRKRLK